MNILKTTILASVFALVAPAAMAASLLIDDFSVYQEVRDDPGSGFLDTNSVVIAGGVTRTFLAETTPSGEAEATILKSTGGPSGTLKFSNELTLGPGPAFDPIGQYGRAVVTYDYTTTIAGAIDLTGGVGLDKFLFAPILADLAGTVFNVTVVSGGGTDTVTEVLDAAFNPFTNFSAFAAFVDFTDVTSLIFEFDANPNFANPDGVPAFDGVLGSISVVPLPASALLLLGGLGGFAGLSAAKRRRRRAA